MCALFARCELPSYHGLYGGSLESCERIYLPFTTAALAAEGNWVTPEILDACLSKLGPTCDRELDQVPECQFRGALPDGRGCVYSGQCSSGSCFHADPSGAGNCGVCRPRAGEGASCANSNCALGLVCNAATVCVKAVAAGSTCSELAPCGPTLYCVNGTCASASGAGAACDPVNASGNQCDGNALLACFGDNKCHGIAYVKPGSPCGYNVDATAYSECDESTCIFPTTNTHQNGICTAYVQEGGACSAEANTPGCALTTKCVAGKCLKPTAVCQ